MSVKVYKTYKPNRIVEYIDSSLVNKTIDDIAEYLNTNKISYVKRFNIEDSDDVELHIINDDIPELDKFKKYLNLEMDLSDVYLFIIYNK